MKQNTLNLFISLTFGLFFTVGCSLEKRQNKGLVTPQTTSTKLNFTTTKTVIILPVTFNGTAKNFAFDTGADLSLVNREKITGFKTKVSGAGGKKVKVGSETIDSFKIGDLDFQKTRAFNDNMAFFDNIIPNFGGLIGQSIISKVNWLIDYPKKTIEISDKTIETVGFETFSMKNIRDPHIDLIIEGETYSALIDLGSSTAIAIPTGSKLAEKLLTKYTFREGTREVYRVGGSEVITEKIGILPKILFGNSSAETVETKIYDTKQIRIGNDFFKDYIVYIDNTNGVYKVKKTK